MTRRTIVKVFGGLLCLVGLALAQSEQDREGWPELLRYGVLPTEQDSLETSRGPFFEHLEETLGIPVQYYIGNDYGAIVVAMSTRRIEAAQFGPESYVLATQNADVEAVAISDHVENGQGYYSALWTTAASGISSIEEAQGRTLAFVDPASTSGYLVPMVHFMRDLEIRPEDYFSRVIFAGNHSSSLLALLNGHIDVAALSSGTIYSALQSGQIVEGDLVQLWQSELIPNSPIAVRSDLPDSFKQAFKEAVLSFGDPEGLALLNSNGFVEVSDSDYDGVRELDQVRRELQQSGN